MTVSSISYTGGDMSVVSPKTLKAREEASAILIRHAVGKLTVAEAEHALWRVMNNLTDNYDQGYNAGYRAAEEAHAMTEQQRREPAFEEVGRKPRRSK